MNFLFKYAPPNSAIAPIGLKLGACGIKRSMAAPNIKVVIVKNLLFIYVISVGENKKLLRQYKVYSF
jgi:hypothetical protein